MLLWAICTDTWAAELPLPQVETFKVSVIAPMSHKNIARYLSAEVGRDSVFSNAVIPSPAFRRLKRRFHSAVGKSSPTQEKKPNWASTGQGESRNIVFLSRLRLGVKVK